MNAQILKKLLTERENPKLEFKHDWYSGVGKLDDRGWGEYIKDLISLANGNVGYVGKKAYLIIGADDNDPPIEATRNTFTVAEVGELSDLQGLRDITLRKLRSACSPSLPDITIEFVDIDDKSRLLVIEIPVPAGVLKLDRDLNTRGICFRKGTVLIRVGQDVSVADPTEIAALENQFQIYRVTLPSQKKVLHNLPQPDYVRFIGRKEEILKLRQMLHPQDRIWTIVIDGVGGVGKSALALEIAHRYLAEFDVLPEDERFRALIWISAKSALLTTDGIVSRQQATQTIEDIFRTIAICLEEDEIAHSRIEDQFQLIYRAISRQRTLLVIDNLETIDDDRVNAFIRELPIPTKCIVTTRHRIDVADPIRLTGMSKEDALDLIEQERTKKFVQLNQDDADLLFKRTGGIPLAIVWSIGQMGYGYYIKSVLYNLGNTKGDIAKYCFENAVKVIRHKPAYILLVCICISTYYNDRKNLGQMSSLSELDRDEGLVELEKLSLVNKKNNQFSVLPLVKEYVLASMADISQEIVEQIVLKLSEIYPPSGVDAILLTQFVFPPGKLSEIKDKITTMLISQMYDWMISGDDYGAMLCVRPLERLGTQKAITELWAVAGGSIEMGWGSQNIQYAELDAVDALVRFGEFDSLANWVAQGFPHSSYITANDVVQAIEKYGNVKSIKVLDELLMFSNDQQQIQSIQEVKDMLLRNQNQV